MRLTLPCLLLASAAGAQDPQGARWIWVHHATELTRPAGERCWLRTTWQLEEVPARALAFVSADNHFILRVNGALAGAGDDWQQADAIDLARRLRPGANAIELEAWNDGGPAGVLLFCETEGADGRPSRRLHSDGSWLSSPDGRGDWQPARDLAPAGQGPWGNRVRFVPAPRLWPQDGFRVDQIAWPRGSVIAMAVDGSGRLLLSFEGGGVWRMSDADGDGEFERSELYTDAVTSCQGLCWSKGALFMTGSGPRGLGLYRLDAPGAVPALLGPFEGDAGEHGPHAVVEGPDGLLYLAIGNHAAAAQAAGGGGPYRIHSEGHLLPRYLDPRGHATHVRSPGGTVVRVDRDGKEWSLFAGGFRNHYDLTFSPSGDLFTFDSDMEWDMGLPWYRPVRLLHVIPGGEYGWRTGSSCWPETHADSLPSVADVGRGSPTGMCCCNSARFPARLRGALFAGDWSQGRILAFRLFPRGTSHGAQVEQLIHGQPLNVTDLVMSADTLLFATGGRGTRGAVYRLSYVGPHEPASETAAATSAPAPAPVPDRATPPGELAAMLASGDRFVRFRAAREFERRPPAQQAEVAGAVTTPLARAEIALAHARLHTGSLAECAAVLESAADLDSERTALRALEIVLLEQPPEPAARRAAVAERLLERPWRAVAAVDRELAAVLARLAPPGTVPRLLDRMIAEPSRVEQLWLAYALRTVTSGWTDPDRERLLAWLMRTRDWHGGYSFDGYLAALRRDLAVFLSEPQRRAAAPLVSAGAQELVMPAGSGAAVDFDRTLSYLDRALVRDRRAPADGGLVFRKLCAACHRAGDDGGGLGPDLTTVRARLGLRELLEETVDPSRRIVDQYRALEVRTLDGTSVTGMALAEADGQLLLLDAAGRRVSVPTAKIAERRTAARSLMPDGLLDGLTLEEIADLFAFLERPTRVPADHKPLWSSLLHGSTLTGWDGVPALWSLVDGVLTGDARGLPANSFLVAPQVQDDFLLECEVQVLAGNSGIQFRSSAPDGGLMTGYQADCADGYWGALLEEGGRGILARPAFEIWRALVDERGWNHVLITARGDLLRIELNGTPTVEFRDGRARSGRLGLELHAGDRTTARFRKLRVRTAGLPARGG